MPSVSDSNAGICWWSDGLQLEQVSRKEACHHMICFLRTIPRFKISFMG
ncbi:hypothetical protein E1A91_A05G404900v1 [Gossypium mustelinum]|uniref:Uncharacterized protein n=1 Tax=Gossypium mustelinum TaxID=34275 RepID=A0A5D2ZGB9_GOSMU|nr:hypothetical protein E1A91_A05G404900v1 [Gossypium mustelinum]